MKPNNLKSTDLVLHRSRGQRVGLSATTILFPVAGDPTNANECLEAGSGYSGRMQCSFSVRFVGNVAQRAKFCLIQTTLVPRGKYNGLSKHFLGEAGLIRHCKQEGLQHSLVSLFKCCKQPSSKGFIALY